MNILQYIKAVFSPAPKLSVAAPKVSEREMIVAAFRAGKCPDCGCREFYEGPSGGLCINWQCAGCGNKFNIGQVGSDFMVAERI